MSSLLNKINTLLRSRIEAFLADDLGLSAGQQRGVLAAGRLGTHIDREIAALRKHIDEAITYEETLQAEIDALRQEAAGQSRRADKALLHQDEATARRALAEMTTLERKAALLEADLHQHRRSTATLIERVNVLEGLVAEARSQQESETGEASSHSGSPTLDAVLQTTRQEIEMLDDTEENQEATRHGAAAQAAAPLSEDDDLAVRRMRLARHDSAEE